MRELGLLFAIGEIDDDLVAAAAFPPHCTQKHILQHFLAAAACIALIFALLLPRSPIANDGIGNIDAGNDTADEGAAKGDGSDNGGCLFSFAPVLWYGSRGYVWHDVTHAPKEDETWVAAGEIAGVSEKEGTALGDLWLCADFEAAGTVYISDEYPDMVYVRMTTDWLEETYVCFMVPPLSYQPMICFEGRIYCPAAHSNPDIKADDTLPEGFVNAGSVIKATFGKVPDENGETTGWYNGCAIFANPADKSVIYLGAYRNDNQGTQYIYAPAPLLTEELAGDLTIPEALLPAN